MTDPRQVAFDAARAVDENRALSDNEVWIIHAALDAVGWPRTAPETAHTALTERIVLEIAEHESVVLEAYKDSVGVWTWGVGVTSASGHRVDRYKDKPQTLVRCLEVYVWLLRERYLPAVLKAFEGYALAEHQLAAALSFHWNTGRIGSTDWVRLVKVGRDAEAKTFLKTHYLNGGTLTSRRRAEAALFFDAAWVGDGVITQWPVKKPSYSPDWKRPKAVDIRAAVKEVMNATP